MKRVLSGLVMGAAAIALVGWSPRWLLFLALLALVGLALHEFFGLCEKTSLRPYRGLAYVFSFWVLIEQWLFPQRFSLAALAAFVLLALILSLRKPDELSKAVGSAGATVLGALYIGWGLSLLLAWQDPASAQALFFHSPFQSRAGIFFVLATIWAADIGAFYVGRLVGRHKLAPRVSPGKTVEGLAGGLVASWIVATVFQKYWMRDYEWIGIVALATALNLAGVLGDLVESAMKRGAGVKDSSSLIPGHGGVLDRIDSLLFAIPVMYYYPSAWAFLKGVIQAASHAS